MKEKTKREKTGDGKRQDATEGYGRKGKRKRR